VNGRSVKTVRLNANDEITVGGSIFTYSAVDIAPAVENATEITRLRPGDSRYLTPSPDMTLSLRTQRDLKTLLRLANLLHSVRGVARTGFGQFNDAMQSRLEGFLLDLIPADCAAVLPSDAENEVVRQVCLRRVALLMPHPTDPAKMTLAAPIIVRSDVPAAIYLESCSAGEPFDDGHLQFLAAVAEIAAVAWENASLVSWLEEENQRLEERCGLDYGMVGASTRLRDLQQQISRVAGTDSTVLVLGETGTGKELVAHAIHRNSRRAGGPCVAINCASLAETLLESELFGHEKGAFTGAVARKRGRLEMADRGTLFLDEIGELAVPLQVKLLRVLETRTMERVGGTETLHLDIRIVAATNRNLEDAVRRGTFREDLYFRIKVVTLKTPPLRDCPGDILVLAEHFANQCARQCGRKLIGLSPEVRPYLHAYSWPGNVRELKHVIESSVVMGSADTLLVEDLPEQIRAARPPELREGLYAQALETAKREVILRAFDQSDHAHEAAAKMLGLHPNYLHKLMRTLDLKGMKKRD